MRFKSVEEMPPGLRKLFDAQFEQTEDGKFRERTEPKTAVAKPRKRRNIEEMLIDDVRKAHTPDEILEPKIEWSPHRPMNVGADEIALKELNKTERRYLEILRERDEYVWIGVKTMRFRLAGNTHYTPDFQVITKDGTMIQIDSKGTFTREDSQLKMKVVARMFPFFKWRKAELQLAKGGKNPRPESLKESDFPA